MTNNTFMVMIFLAITPRISTTRTTMISIIQQETPLPLETTPTKSVVCMAVAYPKTIFEHPPVAMAGHATMILQYASNKSIVTAGLTGKKKIPKNCVVDNMLANGECEYKSSPPTPVRISRENCAHIDDYQLEVLSREMFKTLSPEFQGGYNLFSWNCAMWVLETWNSLGVPKRVGFPSFIPVPRFSF